MASQTASALAQTNPASPQSRLGVARPLTNEARLLTARFVGLMGAQLGFGLSWSLFLVLPKFLTVRLSANPQQIGLVMSAVGIATLVITPVVSRIVNRLGFAGTVMGANLAMAAAALMFLAVDDIGPLVISARALQGIGWALMFSGGSGAAAALAPPGRLAQAMGWYSSANLFACAIGPLVAEAFMTAGAENLLFGLAAIVALGACATAALACRGLPEPQQPAARSPKRSIKPSRFIVFTVLGLACGVTFTFHQPFALAQGAQNISWFLVAYTGAAVLVRVFLGHLPDRIGHQRVSGWALGLYAFVVAALAGLSQNTLIPLGFAFGVAHGVFYPAFISLCLKEAPSGRVSSAMALVNAAFCLGSMGSWPVGLLARVAGYEWAFGVVGSVTLAAAIGLLRPARRRDTNPV